MAAERPTEIARFELAACIAIVLAQLTAVSDRTYSVWDFAIGAVLFANVLLVSRFRQRVGRLIWSGLLVAFVLVILVGFIVITVRSDIAMPSISNLDLFLSLAGLACDVAAAYFLWSPPASKWLKRSAA